MAPSCALSPEQAIVVDYKGDFNRILEIEEVAKPRICPVKFKPIKAREEGLRAAAGGSDVWKERCLRLALRLKEAGVPLVDIAEELGMGQDAFYKAMKRALAARSGNGTT